jgi:hypothetical protein
MLAGRLIALASFGAWLALIAVAARRLRCSWTHAAFGAIVLAVSMFVFADFYVGVNDPQILGHAVQALGLVMLLGDRRATGTVVAAVLLAAGVFIKNNLIALPLAAALWLIVTDRASGWKLIAAGAVAGVAGVGLCAVAFGPRFFDQLLSPRAILPAKGALMAWQWTRMAILPLAVTGWLASHAKRDRAAAFAVIYAVVSIVTGLLFAVGDGVYWNTMFDANCAGALVAAVALERLPAAASMQRRLAVPAAFLAAPAIVLALSATIHWLSPRFWFDPRWSEAAAAGHEIDLMRRQHGPVLCEDLALCYWAGKPVEVDFFNLQQRAKREPWRIDALAGRLEARDFAVAQTEGRDLGPAFTQALERNYRVDHSNQWGVFWAPRDDRR